MATRATYVFPYSAAVWNVGNARFRSWETVYRDVLFFDVLPFVEQ